MGNKKHIIIAATLAILCFGGTPSIADASNNLLQMDLKKSSVTDTVDVTFYTTNNTQNSVVTRKSNNRYVVLLPNVGTASSANPNIGAVKDLISNVEVKHVNDGIGGYTKVTFETTKPINIKTYTKRSNAVTSVQSDYKNILAQNNNKTSTVTKPQPQTSQTKPQAAVKPVQTQKTTQPQKPKTTVEKPVAEKQVKPVVNKVSEQPKKEVVSVKPKEVTKQILPVKKVENTVTVKKDTPVSAKPQETNDYKLEKPLTSQKVSPKVEEKQTVQPVQETKTTTEKTTKDKTGMPLWLLIAGGALSLGLILGVIRSVLSTSVRRRTFGSITSNPSQEITPIDTEKCVEIANNIEMNWQEKFKRYNEEIEMGKKDSKEKDFSYVTDLGATKQTIVKEEKTVKPEPKTQPKNVIPSILSKPTKLKPLQVTVSAKRDFNNQMVAKISQLEHSLSQTPSLKEPETVSNEVKSEDNSILSSISNVKLKSFARPISLKESNRELIDLNNIHSKNSSYREGRFVKLKNSPLSVSKRQSEASVLNNSDLMNVGDKYLTNIEEIQMTKEKENYLLSSLNEYLSILDNESSTSSAKTPSNVMSRSGVTNPISKTKTKENNLISGNGLIIKSGHSINSDTGIYLVNVDGVSAIVGKIKESTFMLKKFDRVVTEPLQVRRDEDNVYIVRVGEFKCLVDISKDRMGTLIEI